MRIAWFTPFSRKSAIGKYSQAITKELAKSAAVDLWLSDTAEMLDTELNVVTYDNESDLARRLPASYDFAVFNFGDHLGFHQAIYQASRTVPSTIIPTIAILHDFVMHHFFAGYYFHRLKDSQAYLSALTRWYGDKARAITEEAMSGKRKWVWETDEVVNFPFFEEAICNAYGVITHSEFLRVRVADVFDGPAKKIFFPNFTKQRTFCKTRRDLKVPEDNILVVTVGHVNENKRIEAVLNTFAKNPDLTQKLTYAVLGPYDHYYHDRLVPLVQCYGLEGIVRFSGYISDRDLASYLTHADLCVNLRYPAMEGASASIVEQMSYGKPVIVHDTGFYHELPNDCVVKIRPNCELEDLANNLRELIANPALRAGIAIRAKRFSEETLKLENFVNEFLEFTSSIQMTKPIRQTIDRVAAVLSQMGVSSEMAIVDSVAHNAYELFCSERT